MDRDLTLFSPRTSCRRLPSQDVEEEVSKSEVVVLIEVWKWDFEFGWVVTLVRTDPSSERELGTLVW